MSIKTNYEDIRGLERNLFILDERLAEAEYKIQEQKLKLISLDRYVDYLKTQYINKHESRLNYHHKEHERFKALMCEWFDDNHEHLRSLNKRLDILEDTTHKEPEWTKKKTE